MRTLAPTVSCDDLTTIRDNRILLYRVSLDIPAGKRTVILGP